MIEEVMKERDFRKVQEDVYVYNNSDKEKRNLVVIPQYTCNVNLANNTYNFSYSLDPHHMLISEYYSAIEDSKIFDRQELRFEKLLTLILKNTPIDAND